MSYAKLVLKMFECLQEEIFETAKSKGWHENPLNDGEQIALIHSELSEGLEALRNGNMLSDKIGFLGIEEELADAIIRILHYAKRRDFNVIGAMLDKMDYNKGREYKHGNKSF